METKRLILRERTPERMQSVLNMSKEEQLAFYGIETDAQLEKELSILKGGLQHYKIKMRYWDLVSKETGKTLGSAGYHMWYFTHGRAEIGYNLNRDEDKRKGLMTETLRAIIEHGFQEMDLIRIEACIGPDNEASIKLAGNFGFVEEGLLRKHYNGEDSIIYSLLKEDWEALFNTSKH